MAAISLRSIFTSGGRIVWRDSFELMLIGPGEERWDTCFIAEYPSVAAFVDMVRDPAYREAVKHRQAAVADSRLIRLAPMAHGEAFADPEERSRQGDALDLDVEFQRP